MRVYLDHSATTYIDNIVLKEMMPYFNEIYGNASSQHTYGQQAMHAVDKARSQVAHAIGAKDNEIYFTSGGTESDNWAIKGIAYENKHKGNHIIISAIEHPAVLDSCKYLEKRGFRISYIPVDSDGIVKIDELEKAICKDTIMISIMTCNNEIGTIQPIIEIGKIAKDNKILFHTDAVQAIGTVNIDVKEMNIDLLSLSAHKFYGPKGVGALYVRNGVRVDRYISGGEQERKMRAGTYNTPGIVGIGKAIELANENMEEKNKKIASLRDYFVERVLNEIPYVYYNGSKDKRMSSNASLSFDFIEGEALLLSLDIDGIAASSGSACSSGSLSSSHVLKAIGVSEVRAQGTLRFTLGKDTTKAELDYTIGILKKSVNRLREMSPLFNEYKGESTYV